MKTIYDIAKAELQSLFYSPIAWLILIIFSFQTGMTFCGLLGRMVNAEALGYGNMNTTMGLFGGNGLFASIQGYLYLYIPLLTMNLMSRELGSGSIKLLYSSPVTNVQIILGKYLSMLIYGFVLVLIMMVYILCGIVVIKDVDIALIFSGLLGTYLLICAYAAIGLFMSSITSYQVISAVGTLAILAAFTYVKSLWQDVDFIRDLTFWFAMSGRADTFVVGLICSEDVIYYLIVVSLFLSMTILRLQARRQRASPLIVWGKYLTVWVVALFLGYLSSRPTLMSFADVTTTKQNTLTPNSQEIIKKMDGKLTITTYVNILEENSWQAMPVSINYDRMVFKQYVRFKPEIDLKYVYYYDAPDSSSSLAKFHQGLTQEEVIKKIIKTNNLNAKKILKPEEIRKIIDLSPENNRFVRLLERESGEKTFLRIYSDMMRQPGETEISAAFKRIVMELPKVGFLTGHGERSTTKRGERDYSMFSEAKTFRHSLINQGFDVEEVILDKEIPSDVNILVVAEMRRSMTESEKQYWDQYIARGGNLIITGEPNRQEVMNPLIAPFGVSFAEHTLVRPSDAYLADLVLSYPTKEGKDLFYTFAWMGLNSLSVTMPSAVGLEYTTDKGFAVIPLLQTDSIGCWNELETTNFIDDTVKLNPAIGEVEKTYTTALALSRKVGDREQKIVIVGDADCISNGEFSVNRNSVRSYNFGLIPGVFFWLSDNEVPIDVRRPKAPDNKVFLSDNGMDGLRYAFMGGLPALLLCMILLIWIRRRGR